MFSDLFLMQFWSLVDQSDGCWLWGGYVKPNGYGEFGRHPRDYAHRIAWVLGTGVPVPDALVVAHRCDERRCVRFDHLFLATQAENLADMRRKGRQASGDRHGSKTMPWRVARGARSGPALHPESMIRNGPRPGSQGEGNGQARITAAKVRELRALYRNGASTEALADASGLSRGAAWAAASGKTWRYLQD